MNLLTKIYRKIISQGVRTRIGIMRIKGKYQFLRKNGELAEYAKECEYLINHKIKKHQMMPYDFYDEYMKMDVCVELDRNSGLHYVMRNKKRLYYPVDMTVEEISNCYKMLCAEQDERSPHRYFSKLNYPNEDSIIVDVGASEGMISLDFVDIVKKIYLIESDEKWKKALELTFDGYNNVKIVSAFIGSNAGKGEVALHDILAEKKDLVIKMDIEGGEIDALNGMKEMLTENGNKFAVCTYHKHEDAKSISKIFVDSHVIYEYSEGYMWMPSADENQFPYFRHGVIRGAK